MATTAHDLAATQRTVRSRTFTGAILVPALWQAVLKLDPRQMVRNPVMFIVEVGALLTLMLTIDPTIFGGAAATRGLQPARDGHPRRDRALRNVRGSRR